MSDSDIPILGKIKKLQIRRDLNGAVRVSFGNEGWVMPPEEARNFIRGIATALGQDVYFVDAVKREKTGAMS